MAESSFEIIQLEEDIDAPVPASELHELDEEKRILSSVYRHVEHQQVVEQVAGVAGVITEDVALSANESKSPSSPWMGSITQKTSSLPLSAGGSEESESVLGLALRLSAGAGSTDAGDIGRVDSVEELLALPQSLDSALRLNMALQRRFRDRILTLENIYKRNIERQGKLKKEIVNNRAIRENDQKADGTGKLPLRISHFCVPYFKNRSGMPAPMNDDAKKKVEKGYIDLYTTRPRTWMTVEKETLNNIVRDEWRRQKKSSTQMTIRELECKLQKLNPEDQEVVKSLEEDIKNLKNIVRNLVKKPLRDVVPERGEKQLDWDRIAAKAFDGHRTPDECRLQWENLLHPAINTTAFTEKEDLMIQKIVMGSRSKLPDWERLALDMRTNRTAYQVMQRYVSFIEPTLKPVRWTKQESDKLLNTVNMLRVGNHIPWSQVHQHFVGFTRVQIQSRWRIIDPDISKGPFTVEEDFLLIKGLHMFGLNFESIVHFMPGRTNPQVRDRYKRTILPSLCEKPWKKEEDEILIKESCVGSKNWRKMVWKLPRFNACQIRMRYHTIQVWQTISETNLIPPPLFPVTSTVNPETIQEIRTAMIKELPELKSLVDESRKGIKLKNVQKELEERRILIRERKSMKNMQKMKKVTEKRGRQPGVPNPHYKHIQDIFLTEFFIPYRLVSNSPKLHFASVQKSLIALSSALQLKIVRQVKEDDVNTSLLDQFDVSVLKKLTKSHELTGDTGCAIDCPACRPTQPEKSPLFPPCKTTIGAFKSLLVHRPKLKEMASKEFFLYKYNKNELHALGSQYRGRRYIRKLSNYTLTSMPNQTRTDPTSEAEGSQDESDGGALIEIDDESTGQGSKGQTKIHITYKEQVNVSRKSAKRLKLLSSRAKTFDVVKAYSRGKPVKGIKVESTPGKVLPGDTSSAVDGNTDNSATSGLSNIKMKINGEDVNPLGEVNSSVRPESTEDVKAREASDSLLFQRMMSVFFWPALMTISAPPPTVINSIQEKIESGELKKPSKPDNVKIKLDKDDFDVETQAKYISYLSEEARKFEEDRINAMKRLHELRNVTVKEEVDQDSSSENEGVDEVPQKVDGRKFNCCLVTHHRKRQLKSLRRSLVMKKVWDARRKGCFPQRTSDRDKRFYNPRRSRTRDCVRRDMIKPPKIPKIWDFPLDGPMRVQPQASALPSEEMLSAFSESTSDHIEKVNHVPSSDNIEKAESAIIKSRNRNSELTKALEKRPDNADEPRDHKPILPLQPTVKRSERNARKLMGGEYISAKSSLQRKSNLKFISTIADVHSTRTDKPEGTYLTGSESTFSKASELHNEGLFSDSQGGRSHEGTVQTRSKVPSLAVIYNEGHTALEEIPMKVTKGNKVDCAPSTSERAAQPSRKRSFETSFSHLLDDQIKAEVSEYEENTLFDPESIRSNKDESQVPIKKAKSSSTKPYQVSFQYLLDDEVQEDSTEVDCASKKDVQSLGQVKENQKKELHSRTSKRRSSYVGKNLSASSGKQF